MDSAAHAAQGALVSGGGVALLQSALARKLQRPTGLALAVGGFVGTFRLLEALGEELVASIKTTADEEEQTAQRRRVSSVAAAAAALVAMYCLEAKRKGMLVSYATVEALVQLAEQYTTLHSVQHIEVPMAMLACHRIIYQWIYDSHLYTTSQLATLDALTLVPAHVLARVRAELPVNPLVSRCELFHEGRPCTAFTLDLFTRHVPKAMKMYIPIYLLSAVLPKYRQWIYGPRPSVTQLLVQYVRTCVSLSMCFVIPLGFSCVSPIRNHRATVTIAGTLTAMALWIDHEKRRPTVIKAIAVYPLSATATQVGRAMGLSQKSIAQWQYAIFATAMAVLFARPERHGSRAMRLLYGHRRFDKYTTVDATEKQPTSMAQEDCGVASAPVLNDA